MSGCSEVGKCSSRTVRATRDTNSGSVRKVWATDSGNPPRTPSRRSSVTLGPVLLRRGAKSTVASTSHSAVTLEPPERVLRRGTCRRGAELLKELVEAGLDLGEGRKSGLASLEPAERKQEKQRLVRRTLAVPLPQVRGADPREDVRLYLGHVFACLTPSPSVAVLPGRRTVPSRSRTRPGRTPRPPT